MSSIKSKPAKASVKEPDVVYGGMKKSTPEKKSINQLLITPKDQKSLTFLKKLLKELSSVDDVEVLIDEEVQDYALLKQMEKNRKSGYISQEKVMATLNALINKK